MPVSLPLALTSTLSVHVDLWKLGADSLLSALWYYANYMLSGGNASGHPNIILHEAQDGVAEIGPASQPLHCVPNKLVPAGRRIPAEVHPNSTLIGAS